MKPNISTPFKTHQHRPVKKEKLEEQRPEEFSDVYSRHSFAVVENPLFADQEDGDDASYSGGAGDGFEYDSGTLDRKEELVSVCMSVYVCIEKKKNGRECY